MQHHGSFVAYYRVSTQQQGHSGLGLEAQKKAVADYLNGGSWRLAAEFIEVETGKRNDRPELAQALAACRKQRAKLVIAKLDRLSRNLAFIAALMDSGVEFIAVDNPHANKLTVHILAAVAQHEREMIAERTKAALQAAKARGVQLGNPRLREATSRSQIARKSIADQHAANVVPMVREIQRAGANTLREIAEALNVRGIPTPRGGQWHATSVKNALARGCPVNSVASRRSARSSVWS
jgi:DNA invertase Pin-like site-specific DNA recombinase